MYIVALPGICWVIIQQKFMYIFKEFPNSLGPDQAKLFEG
jgi:hypothetical protein